MSSSHIARIRVSYALLIEALHMPGNISILDVEPDDLDGFVLFVEHPDLPVVLPGGSMPLVDPSVEYIWHWNIRERT